MTIQLKVQGLEELQRALADAPREIASAARNALNDTARKVQRDYRATLSSKFDVRKKTFIERQVYFGKEDQATKDRWAARLSIRGPGGQTATLEKFERDPEKRARAGGRLVVPAKGIRTTGGHVQAKYAFNKLAPLREMGGRYTKLRKKKGRLVSGKSLTSKRQLVGQRGTFVVRLATGYDALVERVKGTRSLKPLWIFRPATKIPNPLHFDRDVTTMAWRTLPGEIEKAIGYALERAKLR